MNMYVRSIQFSHSVVSDSGIPWTAACQASLSITNSWILLKLMSTESVMPSNHLILCHPLLLLPSIFPRFRVFSNESVIHIRWPKYWSFSFSSSPFNEYSGLISFSTDRFDFLAVQGTLTSHLQHHSLNTYIKISLYTFTHTILFLRDTSKNEAEREKQFQSQELQMVLINLYPH